LEPGDVRISIDERLSASHTSSHRRRLIAAVPVYDEQSGDSFGLVVIETDLISQIQSILNGLDDRAGEIYITDAEGRILVTSNPEFGVEVASKDVRVSDLVTETADFFTKNSKRRSLSDASTFIARRIQLDPSDAACSLGIVQQLVSDD
jgi:hypothetical protein